MLERGHHCIFDSAIARIGGEGRFIPATFYPVAGYIPMIWCPRWAEQVAAGALLLIDTSMIGIEPFSVFYPHDKLRYDDLAGMLPDIFLFETYVYCTAHSIEPMTSRSEWPVYQGLTLVLQRDPFQPFTVYNASDAFRDYARWGNQVEHLEHPPPAIPAGVRHVAITNDGATSAFATGAEELTCELIWRFSATLTSGSDTAQCVVARATPERALCRGTPVFDQLAVFEDRLPDGVVCIFASLRGIGLENGAYVVDDIAYEDNELLMAMQLEPPGPRGFRVVCTGGQYTNGKRRLRSGELVTFRFISEHDMHPDDLAVSQSSSEDGDPHDSSSEEDDPQDEVEEDAASSSASEVHDVTVGGDSGSYGMWNRAGMGQDVFRQDRRGDTPTREHERHSSGNCTCHHGERRKISGWSQRIPLIGAILVQHFIGGTSMTVACDVRAKQEISLPMLHDESHQGDICTNDSSADPPADLHLIEGIDIPHNCLQRLPCSYVRHLSQQAAVAGHDDLEHDISDGLVTLLEDAKNVEFQKVCEGLVWFFRDLHAGTRHGKMHYEVHRDDLYAPASLDEQAKVAEQCRQALLSLPLFPCTSAGASVEDFPILCGAKPGTWVPSFNKGDSAGHERLHHESLASWKIPLHEQPQPQTILLASLIGGDSGGSNQCYFKSEANLEMLEWLQEGYTLDGMSTAADQIGDLHANTLQSLLHMKLWHSGDPAEEVHLYTDGSYLENTRQMAWSVVAVVRWHDQWSFAGFFSARVSSDEHRTDCAPSAYLAEVHAILHAMVLTSNIPVHVTILYDCTSAADTVSNASRRFDFVSQQTAALAVILRQFDKWPSWRHVKGHNGDPLNELADSVAKAACKGSYQHSPHDEDRIMTAINEQWLAWVWTHVAAFHEPCCWPAFHQDGCVYESQAFKNMDAVPAPENHQDCHVPEDNEREQEPHFDLRLATYNCLSLKLVGQLECIEAFCVQQGLHVVGFQETKMQWSGIAHSTHFMRYGAAANKIGHEGCQLWFRKGEGLGCSSKGEAFGWDFDAFAIIHESERCLAVSAKAGGMEFICVTAHAHTTVSKDGDVTDFWRFLAKVASGFPPKALQIYFLDANAHFDESVRAGAYYLPTNLNAQLLRDFVHAHSLVLSDLWSQSGDPIYTWVSPQGQYRCLDFIAVPAVFQGYFQVQGSWDALDRFAGFDHFMLGAALKFRLDGRYKQRPPRIDGRAVCTPEGQAKLSSIYHNMPRVHWSVHASHHWDIVCRYLQDSCRQAFTGSKGGPRKPYIDHQTWELLGDLKSVRCILRFQKIHFKKKLMFECFKAWRMIALHGAGLVKDFGRTPDVASLCQHHNFNVAQLWKRLRLLKQLVGQALQACQAQRVRACFEEARQDGPRALAHLMTSLTKKGRRYKAPKMLPPLRDDNGVVMTSRDEVLERLGDFFAKAEKAKKITKFEYNEMTRDIRPDVHEPWHCDEVPHVGVLANAFRKLKNGKAPGGSGLPPEVFSQASQQAAMTFFPLFLKGFLKHEFATGLLGSVVAPIPKPNKNLHEPSGWRSIALQECVAKAIASMFRGELVQAFNRQADVAQLGGRPKGPIGVPAHLIQSHVRRMAVLRKSAAVIFVDGTQAFYSVFREAIVGCDDYQLEATALVRLIQALSGDPHVQEDLFKVLVGPSILQAGGVSPAVCGYMKASLRNTFYQLDTESDVLYHTLVGTVPGAPLADILFQLAMTRFHARLRSALAEENLQVQVVHPCTNELLSSSVPAWVDDLAVPIEAAQAKELIPQVVKAITLVEEKLRCTGVAVNFGQGKTEVLVAWRGQDAKKQRHFWCVEQNGAVEVALHDKGRSRLHLVDRYVHLGSLVRSDGNVVDDIRHRAALARPSFKAIKDRLLRNPCLTVVEKTRLIVQGPVSSFLHGAGTWVMTNGRKGQAFKAFSGVLSGFMRASLRPVLGWSPRGLDDVEVFALLRVLNPSLTLTVARLRHLAGVAAWLDAYAIVVLLEEGAWLSVVRRDLLELQQVVTLPFDIPSGLGFQEWRRFFDQVAQGRDGYKAAIRKAVKLWSQSDDALWQGIAHKAACFTRLFDGGGVVWRVQDKLAVSSRAFECHVCGGWFATKAALGSHKRHMHGIPSGKASIGGLTACQKCRSEFWTVQRLWDHLRRRPMCMAAHTESDVCFDVCFGADSGLKASAEIKPATVMMGPQPYWATLDPNPGIQQPQSVHHLAQDEEWQRHWHRFLNEDPASRNPKALGTLVRQIVREEGWREKLSQRMHLQDSFGTLCQVLHAGCGQLLDMWVCSKGQVWAISTASLREAADSAICF